MKGEEAWQKEAAPASKANNGKTANVYYLCQLAADVHNNFHDASSVAETR